jgi:chromatin remodeling complex protein RSC6
MYLLMEPLVEESSNVFDQFEVIIDSLSHFRIQVNTIQQQIRQLEKNIKKEMKGLKKAVIKSKNKGNKKPSGFANPTKVTKELCEFMNKQEGTQIARTEVTRALILYIKENNLQNKANKKIILPDEKLQFLLGINQEQELTYFNLQKYMNKHFISEPVFTI